MKVLKVFNLIKTERDEHGTRGEPIRFTNQRVAEEVGKSLFGTATSFGIYLDFVVEPETLILHETQEAAVRYLTKVKDV
jgi:hypothetical protein